MFLKLVRRLFTQAQVAALHENRSCGTLRESYHVTLPEWQDERLFIRMRHPLVSRSQIAYRRSNYVPNHPKYHYPRPNNYFALVKAHDQYMFEFPGWVTTLYVMRFYYFHFLKGKYTREADDSDVTEAGWKQLIQKNPSLLFCRYFSVNLDTDSLKLAKELQILFVFMRNNPVVYEPQFPELEDEQNDFGSGTIMVHFSRLGKVSCFN